MPHDDPELLPELDQPPKSGVYIDHDADPLTDDDVALGNALAEAIDVDDDENDGRHLL